MKICALKQYVYLMSLFSIIYRYPYLFLVWFLASCIRISLGFSVKSFLMWKRFVGKLILENKHRKFRSEQVKETGHMEDLDIDGRIILKWLLSKQFEDLEWIHFCQLRVQ